MCLAIIMGTITQYYVKAMELLGNEFEDKSRVFFIFVFPSRILVQSLAQGR